MKSGTSNGKRKGKRTAGPSAFGPRDDTRTKATATAQDSGYRNGANAEIGVPGDAIARLGFGRSWLRI